MSSSALSRTSSDPAVDVEFELSCSFGEGVHESPVYVLEQASWLSSRFRYSSLSSSRKMGPSVVNAPESSSLQSEAREPQWEAEVDEYDKSVDSSCANVWGEDGGDEGDVSPNTPEEWEYRSLIREVDADVWKPECLVTNLGCEWDRRSVDGEK